MTSASVRPVDFSEHWNAICLRELAKIEPGWATGDELSWAVFKQAEVIRGRTRAVLRRLGEDGIIERFDVRHRGELQDCYLVDPEALRRLAE